MKLVQVESFNFKYSTNVLLHLCFLFTSLLSYSQHNTLFNSVRIDTVFGFYGDNFNFRNYSTFDFTFPYLAYINHDNDSLIILNIEKPIKKTIKLPTDRYKYLSVNNGYFNIVSQRTFNTYKINTYSIVNDSLICISEKKVNRDIHKGSFFYINEKKFFAYSINLQQKHPINLYDNKKSKGFNFLYPFLLSTQPTNYVDFTYNRILLSQAAKYQISVFDKKFNHLSTINYEGISFSGIDTLKAKLIEKSFNPKQPSESFGRLNSLQANSDLIWQANFLNDSTIFIVRTVSKSLNSDGLSFKYDVWQLSNNKWKPIYFDVVSKDLGYKDCIINRDCLPFRLFEYGTHFIVKENMMVVLKLDIPYDITDMSVREYTAKKEEYYLSRKNKPYYKLYLVKFLNL